MVEEIKKLDEEAKKRRLIPYNGFVFFAGQMSDGSYKVDFRTASLARSSLWPKWAYEVALDALLHSKPLHVVADGEPLGDKLDSVLIFNTPV
jgi:hypothetical protein